MLHLAAGFVLGGVVGFLTALLLNVHFSLQQKGRPPSRFLFSWIRLKIFALSLWERKARYVLVLAVCVALGLWIGSLTPSPEGGAPEPSWADRAWGRMLRVIARDWGR